MSDAYGYLASFYQPLSRLVFGKDLIEANQVFEVLASGKKSLILGGGDATAYREWDERFGGEYWDTSPKMTDLARSNLDKSGIEVHAGHWLGAGHFDVVFLPFVLDTMPDQEIEKIFIQIRSCLNPSGRVVFSDFFSPKTFSQQAIQELMIIGFRVFAGHQRKDLPDYDRFFDPKIWRLSEEKTWRKGWIRARVYELRGIQRTDLRNRSGVVPIFFLKSLVK